MMCERECEYRCDLEPLLPENISDEAARVLCDFLYALATASRRNAAKPDAPGASRRLPGRLRRSARERAPLPSIAGGRGPWGATARPRRPGHRLRGFPAFMVRRGGGGRGRRRAKWLPTWARWGVLVALSRWLQWKGCTTLGHFTPPTDWAP